MCQKITLMWKLFWTKLIWRLLSSLLQQMLECVSIIFIKFWIIHCYLSVSILTGKSGGAIKFGCPYCSASAPYQADGTLYTLGQLLELHEVNKGHQKYCQFNNFAELRCWRFKHQEAEVVPECHQYATHHRQHRGSNFEDSGYTRAAPANRLVILICI